MINLNANALTTPDRFRALAGDCSFTNDQIAGKINALSERLESLCGRKFGYIKYPTTAPQLLQGHGMLQLFFLDRNIRTIEAVFLNGTSYDIEVVTSATQIPLYGATIFRTPEWDLDGMLYCPVGWTMWAGAYRDLTGDANLNTLSRLYNIQIAWEGGWILPYWDRKIDANNNPGGDPMDLPSDLEGAVVQEIENRLARPNRWLQREKTPGGTDVQYDVRLNEEFSTDTLPVFLSYRTPKAVFV